MYYLLLASFCSLLIVVVFKLFERYCINANQAIVTNYVTCVVTGCITMGAIPFELDMLYEPWMPIMLFLGFLFIGGFNMVSLTVDHYGMAIATVAQRMSLGLSSAFAIWYYSESYTSYKILGILIALSAVVFINVPAKNIQKGTSSNQQSNWYIVFPVSICLISAIIEIALQYLHTVHKILPAVESVVLFCSAATVGLLFLSGKVLFFNEKLKLRNLVAGILLGVPNYFSIYFILLALNNLDGSTVYSLSNILVVTAAALTGLLVFKEQLSKVNVLGVAFAVLAIFLIVL